MKNFIKGSSVLLIGDLLTKLISVLYLIPLVRINKEIITLMTNLLIPFGFFIVFSTIGINLILTNELVKAKNEDETKKVLIDVGLIIGVCTIIGSIIMLLVAPTLMHTIELNETYAHALTIGSQILTIGVILFSLTSYMRSILMAYGAYNIISITFITEQIIRVGIILLGVYYTLILNSFDVVVVVYIIVIAILISMLSTFLAYLVYFLKYGYYKNFIQGKYIFSMKHIRYLIFAALILFAGGIYVTVFDQIDLLLLNTQMLNHGYTISQINQIKGEYFTLSFKIVMVPISISSAFIQVMIKQIGESTNQKAEINKILYFVSLYSIFMLVSISFMGNNIYELFYGTKGTGIIVIQSLIIPVYIIKNVIGGYIITNKGNYRSIIYSTVAIISLKIILDIILFNYFLLYGYSIASVISLIIGIIILITMNKELFINIPKELLQNGLLFIKAFVLLLILVLLNIYVINKIPLENIQYQNLVLIIIKGIVFLATFIILYFTSIKKLIKE